MIRHDKCEQKKHVLLCKMSPASHFFLFEKGEKKYMKSVHSCREETLWQTFCPTSRSRCIFKNSDSPERKVFFRDIACDRLRSHAIAWWQSGVESRKTRAHKKNRTRPNRTPPHMNMSPYPQRLCPRSPWQHPPWTRVTAPHLPMSPVQALGGAARSHRSRSPCFGRQKGTLR